MKIHIVYNFFFYIHKKINIQKIYQMKKILTIKLIFNYQEIKENYLFYLKRCKRTHEKMRAERMNLCLTSFKKMQK